MARRPRNNSGLRELLIAERQRSGESPILSPPGFRAGLSLFRIQLMSRVTGWWVCLHRAAYSARVR